MEPTCDSETAQYDWCLKFWDDFGPGGLILEGTEQKAWPAKIVF